MNITRILPALASCLLLIPTGCMMRVADCTVASTKNVKLSKVDIDTLPKKKGVEGSSTQTSFLFIPLSGPPNLKDAIDDALAKGDGDLMVDAVFYRGSWWFIFGQDIITVKGEVVKTRTN